MQNITAAKQVGSLSYMVESQTILDLILRTGRIKSSQKPERNPNTGEESKFVSFSRNMTSAAIRNSKRWRWGVIIDGDRLSDRYSIVPISFVGVLTNKNSANFKVKCITKYDENAKIQKRMAEKLFSLLERNDFDKILEIGCGTGLLTKIAIEKLMNQSISITQSHGQFFEYNNIPVMPTYHPSALLRNTDLKRPAWEDLKKFKAKLEEFI